jgi:predicted AAA+ superfamily ATPase
MFYPDGMVTLAQSPMGRIVPRHASAAVAEALADTRVVLVNGARQVGKSTLVSQLARERDARWFTFDRPEVAQAALRDPASFVRAADHMVIDEVQRVPTILLAIKEVVDQGYVPGRFLLTGSARLLGLRSVPDTLPGRMETIELWPLSQGEIDSEPDGFVAAAFRDGAALRISSDLSRDDYIARLVRGGFPGAVARDGRRRARFLESYVADLLNRDVLQVSAIEHADKMRALVTLLAGRNGQIVSLTNLSDGLGVSKQTVERYIGILREVFLVKLLPAFSRGSTARAIRSPKVIFVDSGIAAVMAGQDEAGLRKITSVLGGLLEGFVAAEIARQLTWADRAIDLYHYRTRDGVEVDLVLQSRSGQVVAIEVKSSTSVGAHDFRGIRHLRDRLGDDLVVGVVLYLGGTTLSFGDRLLAMPVSALWQAS